MPPKTEKKAAPKRKAAKPAAKRGASRTHTRAKNTASKAKPTAKRKGKVSVPKEDFLRFVPLGGLEEIGRNMAYLEYKDDIVIIDMGFQFPEENTPGIDYIIPNISELKPKKDKIRAVVITHGHFDHIGAIPYLIGKLGNPTIYTQKLSKAIIERRQEEFVNAPKLKVIEVKYGDKKKIGKDIELEFFGVEHTIPDSMGVIVKTPIGNIVSFGDFRLERDEHGKIHYFEEMERVGRMGVHTLTVDSTGALVKGHGVPEKEVEKNLEMLFKEAEGRIIVATFSSMLTRIGEMIKVAEKLGRKVIINGRSMKQNVQIAKQLGYFKFKEDTLIPIQEINKYKDDKIMVISTGAQGEPNAGLMRIVNGEHKYLRIKRGDTFIFSSSVIPGNERSVQTLTDNIARQGAIVHNSKLIDIHASGHAPQEDLKLAIEAIKPKYLVPIHGYYHFRYVLGDLGVESGVKKENIRLLDNGVVSYLTKNDFIVSDEVVPTNYVMIDGLGVGDVEEVVIRDRLMLAEEGMIVIITTLDRKTGRLVKNPDIISRGFIYLRDNQELLKDIRAKIKSIINRIPRHQQVESDYIKALFRDQIGQFVFKKTRRRPMILPVIIEV